jgi:hypothetical protein
MTASLLPNSNAITWSTARNRNEEKRTPSSEANDEQSVPHAVSLLASCDLSIGVFEEDEAEHDDVNKSLITAGGIKECDKNNCNTALGSVEEPRRRRSYQLCHGGKRQVWFNEIATVHVYQPQLPPTIPILYQPALQKTEFCCLASVAGICCDHGAASATIPPVRDKLDKEENFDSSVVSFELHERADPASAC